MGNHMRDSLIEDWALAGLSVKQIVVKLAEKEIPTANKTVAKVLKNKGFEYNNSNFTWHRTENNINLQGSNVNTVEPIEEVEIVNSSNQVELIKMLGFTLTEFDILRSMVQDKMEGKTEGTLIDEVVKLKITDRATKSYYISDDLTKQMKEIADKNNIKISNAIEVAFIHFINKYK